MLKRRGVLLLLFPLSQREYHRSGAASTPGGVKEATLTLLSPYAGAKRAAVCAAISQKEGPGPLLCRE